METATLHPALLLGISDRKGTLDYGSDADFLMIDDELNVLGTYIAGDQVWRDTDAQPLVVTFPNKKFQGSQYF